MTELTGKVAATASVNPTVLRGRFDASRLVPYTSMAVQVDKAPLLRGYPSTPRLWCTAEPVLSAEGVTINSARPTPQEMDLKSDARFLATADRWSSVDGEWMPYSGGGGYYFFAPATRQPVLGEHEYLQGKELIRRSSFRISDGRYFLGNFKGGSDYHSTLTISLVLSPNPSAGDYPIIDYMNPTSTTEVPGPDERIAIWMTDKIDYHWGGTGGSVDPIATMAKYRPLMLTMVIEPPLVSMYASYSARHHFFTTKAAQRDVGDVALRYAIGNSWLGDSEADFNLFEVNMWSRPLASPEVIELHRKYTAIYGMHSDFT